LRAAISARVLRVGLVAGLAGGVTIWIYEAVVWVGAQHLMSLAGIPRNATGLVFGKAVQEQLGPLAYLLGTAIHLAFSLGGACCLRSYGRSSAVAASTRPWSRCSMRWSPGS
jgi:hypothetical protein